jgi:hypothetical protein
LPLPACPRKAFEEALEGRMKGIPARAEPAGAIFAERNPLALLC